MLRGFTKRHALGTIAFAATALIAASSLSAKPPMSKPDKGAVAPPNANVYGMSLRQWLGAYWAWSYSVGSPANMTPYQPGKAPVVFMPLPQGTQVAGDWTADNPAVLVGKLDVTLPAGTGFVLPFFAWIAERYQGYPAVPDDPFVKNDLIQTTILNPQVTLDGRPIVQDFWSYYVPPTPFNPVVMYPAPSSYGSVGAVGYQSAGMVVHPLSVGKHVIHLSERMRITDQEIDIPGYQLGTIYDNTWNITVVPGKK